MSQDDLRCGGGGYFCRCSIYQYISVYQIIYIYTYIYTQHVTTSEDLWSINQTLEVSMPCFTRWASRRSPVQPSWMDKRSWKWRSSPAPWCCGILRGKHHGFKSGDYGYGYHIRLYNVGIESLDLWLYIYIYICIYIYIFKRFDGFMGGTTIVNGLYTPCGL